MSARATKVRLMPVAGMTAFALLAGFYAYGTSMGTVASFYNTLGNVVGVSVGLALPALEAIRARRAMYTLRLERLRETVTVVNISRRLADQASVALCHGACDGSYFQTTYNRSQIEHAIRLVDQIEPVSSTRRGDDAVVDTRRDLRTFFSALHSAASDFQDFQAVPERVIASLRASYGNVAHDIDCLETECRRLEEKIDFWHVARKV
ncbi:hypothetical protein SBC1_38350 (plasmid) [Caballeronia sp. SBC1]|uniref:hypothetical protein n=1 Tax=unclassified Caballeronia TaxID=2646786 RepID=UPI0013E1909D|nr:MULTISPECIES: hypothetical protein [unclassified Caballeronia]QIE26889.1 hypothetical protein SBC2_49590 [Caballeronia sp. SBC2]QIN63795.1 hypothetical protein SBC1_38350 [Caballeronia sp. SBC1]